MVYHGLSWFVMDYRKYITKNYHRLKDHQGLSGIIIVYHGFQWFIVDYHKLMYHQGLSWI